MSRPHSEVGWPVPFLAAFSFPSIATRYPFTAGWTVSEHPNYDLRVRLEPSMFRTAVKRSNHLATRPYIYIYINIYIYIYIYIIQLCRGSTESNFISPGVPCPPDPLATGLVVRTFIFYHRGLFKGVLLTIYSSCIGLIRERDFLREFSMGI